MENKIKIGMGVFIALVFALGGGYYLDDNVYHCESRDLVGVCDKLSSGIGSRCYFNDTYKTCKEGWKKIEGFIESKPIDIHHEKYICSNLGCEEIN